METPAAASSATCAWVALPSGHDPTTTETRPKTQVRRKNMTTARSVSLDADISSSERCTARSIGKVAKPMEMPFLKRWRKSYTSPKLMLEATSISLSSSPSAQVTGGILPGKSQTRSGQRGHHRHGHHYHHHHTEIQEHNAIDVFLGGSCNPTTWRKDIAMPMLNAAQVSFYNPQVDEWYEELAAIEAKAKEQAKVILMVVDVATRSIVSINEAVEYICRQRRVVLVVQDIVPGTKVDDIELNASEIADLNGARACLRNLATKRSIPVFEDVQTAIGGIVDWMQAKPVSNPRHDVPRLRKRTSIVLNEWANYVRPARVTTRSCSTSSLTAVLDSECDHRGSEEHCSKCCCGRGSVYLGGTLLASTWREKTAIPLLNLAGIRYFVPGDDYLTHELVKASSHDQALDIEQASPAKSTTSVDVWRAIENEKEYAELILFVIAGNARSIAAMTEAVELVCSHYAVLLVIEPLLEGCKVEDGTAITGRQFRDLFRARCYLQEAAERHDIEVFSSVEDAVQSIIERLQ